LPDGDGNGSDMMGMRLGRVIVGIGWG